MRTGGNIERKDLQDEARLGAMNIEQKENVFGFAENERKRSEAKEPIASKLFKGGNKYIFFGAAGLLLVSVILLVLYFAVWSKTAEPSNTKPSWSEEINNVLSGVNSTYNNQSSDTSYFDAIGIFDDKIEKTSDADHKFDLIIMRDKFIIDKAGASGATDVLAELPEIDESTLDDSQKYQLYLTYQYAYRTLGDEEGVNEYETKINELPKDLTTEGGPDE